MGIVEEEKIKITIEGATSKNINPSFECLCTEVLSDLLERFVEDLLSEKLVALEK